MGPRPQVAAALALAALLVGSAGAADVPDELVVVVDVPARGMTSQSITYYYNNRADRLCYSFGVPGVWQVTEESGRLRHETRPNTWTGVAVWSAADLAAFEGPDLIRRAIAQIARRYETDLGKPLPDVRITPFPASKPGAMKWDADWKDVEGRHRWDTKVFVEITPGWIAQITVLGLPNDDAIRRYVIDTLSTAPAPDCYRTSIREKFPRLRF